MNKYMFMGLVMILSCQHQDDRHASNISEADKTTITHEVDNINSSDNLKNYLIDIWEADQKYRTLEDQVLAEYGHGSEEYEDVWFAINRTDHLNLLKVELILSKFGYPNVAAVGADAAHVPWLVIHHASDIGIRRAYFQIIYKAYKDGNITPLHMDFYLGRMYQIEYGDYFEMPSPYQFDQKIDTLIHILRLDTLSSN